jgi:hypothetical protein
MDRRRIVTLNSLPAREGGLESGPTSELEHRLLGARHDGMMRRLQREAQAVGSNNVMITVPDRDVSRIQSELARQAAAVREGLPSNALEAKFGTGLKGGDWWGWLKSTFDWVDREDVHPAMRPPDARPFDLRTDFKDGFTVALFGDWGTGLYGAPRIVEEISKRGPFDLLLHLGDVYYSGTTDEMQERLLDMWPTGAGRISRTLNGNHEMYSGGYGYFDLALAAFEQSSSYFAFQNDHWLLIGLDTAYVDHDLDQKQIGWLHTVIGQAGRRKVVLFSHHQLFSRLGHQGGKLENALAALLHARIIKAWYWGHEHQCVLYDPHPGYGLFARCLGNGGIPEPRTTTIRNAGAEETIGTVQWKRLSATAESPSCLVLDGPNQFVEGEEEKFGPHGFMTLFFEGARLTESVFLADGTPLHEHIIV